MKKLLLISIIIFSTLIFASSSFADWTKVSQRLSGDTFYVDLEGIRKVDEYVYYWELSDFLKLTKNRYLSAVFNKKGDCKLFRYKTLSFSAYKVPMGNATPSMTETLKNPQWEYPHPTSAFAVILKSVCSK